MISEMEVKVSVVSLEQVLNLRLVILRIFHRWVGMLTLISDKSEEGRYCKTLALATTGLPSDSQRRIRRPNLATL